MAAADGELSLETYKYAGGPTSYYVAWWQPAILAWATLGDLVLERCRPRKSVADAGPADN